ncbi:MAG: zinc ribbon domain-containing protein [Clostridia bacterium]|nr:zinc ribbon domain-containing protein [Clostridia bacterium]
MSYCVNCGVELAPSEKQCPLCGAEVMNPAQPAPENPWQPYPHRDDPLIAQINRRFIAAMITIALTFPMAICLAIDYSYSGQLSWSLYVAGALAMLWCWLAPGFLYKKARFLPVMLPISCSLLGFLYLVEYLTAPATRWFVPLAMPLVLLLTVLAGTVTILARRSVIRGFAIPAAILIGSGLMAAGTDLLITQLREQHWIVSWSWFVLLPSLAGAAIFLVIARRQKMRTEILKRLHI